MNSRATRSETTMDHETLQFIFQRLDTLEEDSVNMKLRCEDSENENEGLRGDHRVLKGENRALRVRIEALERDSGGPAPVGGQQQDGAPGRTRTDG